VFFQATVELLEGNNPFYIIKVCFYRTRTRLGGVGLNKTTKVVFRVLYKRL